MNTKDWKQWKILDTKDGKILNRILNKILKTRSRTTQRTWILKTENEEKYWTQKMQKYWTLELNWTEQGTRILKTKNKEKYWTLRIEEYWILKQNRIEQNSSCSQHQLKSPNNGSRVTVHQISQNLDTRVTSTKGTIFLKRFFPNPKISFLILDELKKPSFWGNREKSAKLKGLESWIHFKDRCRWWGSP
jgi:hypothetical protein